MNIERLKLHYGRLIESRRGQTDCHHIVPKSLGGSNDPENLVHLTHKEHFVAHHLLAKIYGGKMWTAFFYMCNASGVRHSSRTYAIARDGHARQTSLVHTGKIVSQETRDRMAASRIGVPKSESRRRMSESAKGRLHSEVTKAKMKSQRQNISDETRQKLSESHSGERHHQWGKPRRLDTRAKISETLKNKPRVTCPHCDKSGVGSAMNRYHFDNCKEI